MICKNCNQDTTGKYCQSCGQSTSMERITFSNLASDFSESILQFNKGILFTFKELSRRPGHTIRDYLDGKRKNHYKPIAYLLVLSTVYFIVGNISGENTHLGNLLTGVVSGIEEAGDTSETVIMLKWLADNYAYTSLILLPVFSLASYLCFRRQNYNYVEHVVLNSYVTGHQAILYLLITIPYKFIDYDLTILLLIFPLVYCIWTFLQFFETRPRPVIFLLTIVTYLLYLVLIILVVLLPIIIISIISQA